jgi:hypothetical protein
MKRINRTIGILCTMACLLAGCENKAPVTTGNKQPDSHGQPTVMTGTPEENGRMARKMVERYNQLLIEGYRKLNMTPLQEVATEQLAKKAYYHMAAISEGFSRMNSTLKKIEFVKTEFTGPSRCQVQTREVWDFFYSDIKSGKLHKEVRDYVYHVNYVMEITEGRWMITDIVATGDEDPKKSLSWEEIYGKGGPIRKGH